MAGGGKNKFVFPKSKQVCNGNREVFSKTAKRFAKTSLLFPGTFKFGLGSRLVLQRTNMPVINSAKFFPSRVATDILKCGGIMGWVATVDTGRKIIFPFTGRESPPACGRGWWHHSEARFSISKSPRDRPQMISGKSLRDGNLEYHTSFQKVERLRTFASSQRNVMTAEVLRICVNFSLCREAKVGSELKLVGTPPM